MEKLAGDGTYDMESKRSGSSQDPPDSAEISVVSVRSVCGNLNGNQIIPVNESWAILLTEFIRQLNTFGDGEMPEEALEKDSGNTCRNVKKFTDVDPERTVGRSGDDHRGI